MKGSHAIDAPRRLPAGDAGRDEGGARISAWYRPSPLSPRVQAAWERGAPLPRLIGLDACGGAWVVSNAVEGGPYRSLGALLYAYGLSEEDLIAAGV